MTDMTDVMPVSDWDYSKVNFGQQITGITVMDVLLLLHSLSTLLKFF